MSDPLPTVSSRLRHLAEHNADRPMVACGGDWRGAGVVAGQAQRLAAGLHDLGVQPGDRVASMMTNRDEAVDLFLACAVLGAIHVPVNVFLRGEFLQYQLLEADPTLVIADAAAVPPITKALQMPELGKCRLVLLDAADEPATAFRDLYLDPVLRWPDPGPDDLVCILYTSGTTGMPKGCLINNGYLVHMPIAHATNGWFTPLDTSLCPLPLYHGFALSALMDTLIVGCRVSFDPEFRAATLIPRAREIGATQIFGVGAMAAALLRTPNTSGDTDHEVDRGIFIPLAPDVQRELEARFHMRAICEGYGQTEVVPATMGSGESAVWGGRASAGKRVPWLDVQVVDDDDRLLSSGETGEIVVRPLEPYRMFSGYWRKEQATLEAWRNLWHHTGDLGCFDPDGRLYFVDRKKDALRRRGENVSSLELERAIVGHPGIAQVAVHATPAGVREDEIKACLVLEPGVEVAPAQLFEFFRANLPYYAVPRYIEFLPALPVNAVGRVQKHKLRAEWDSPATIDFQELGLVIARADRR